jgi:hypothetical protein
VPERLAYVAGRGIDVLDMNEPRAVKVLLQS